MKLEIKKDKCISCGKCVKDCVALALKLVDGIPKIAENGEKRCMNCQHCLAVCPTGALSINNKHPQDCPPIFKITNQSYNELSNLIYSRRSIRAYKPEVIDNELISKLFSQLRFAPTGCNNHDMQFIIVSDQLKLNRLRKLCSEKVVQAIDNNKLPKPLMELFGDMRNALASGIDLIFRGAPHVVFAANSKTAPCKGEDSIIALSYFDLLAKSVNLGTTWCGLALLAMKYIAPELLSELNIDEEYELSYAMLFGYPDVEYSRGTNPDSFSVKLI